MNIYTFTVDYFYVLNLEEVGNILVSGCQSMRPSVHTNGHFNANGHLQTDTNLILNNCAVRP